ncbi:MAG: class I SAM-dependent methyltransferase [Bdellovibrio sp. CG10_big_fil_rev_8_21_14_0_10_47_8]|nr:MAG: class I SAM-dependent methyltransferase [Bdellovibrio sp. CG10_big_fil_rev_8_21_14_0_10_47_8]
MSLPERYVSLDEEGYPLFGEVRVSDPDVGAQLLRNVRFAENGAYVTSMNDHRGTIDVILEPFDEPYVAAQVLKTSSGWRILLPYHLEMPFDPLSMSVDEWDRFHGMTIQGIPFVLSRKAQNEFFNLVDEFDDESITIDQKRILLPAWLNQKPDVRTEKYWSQIYQTEEPRWELSQPAPALVDMLPRLKLPKSRVLVLGCGSGNDAAFFAENGHVVTAVDISSEALERAQKKYGHLKNIRWIHQDIFTLGDEHTHSYDLVFEHTCFCAIDPSRRKELVNTWSRLLAPQGHLLGVFFAMERRTDPPFGSTEWELRERLKKSYQFLFWGRWHLSIDRRNGKELLIYAQKKT